MELNTEALAKYVGGQMEIQNQKRGYIYRGEVKSITIEHGELRVTFAWFATGEGFPPRRWVKYARTDYAATLDTYGASDIGNARLALHSSSTGELIVLFPLGGSRLDPARVEGL